MLERYSPALWLSTRPTHGLLWLLALASLPLYAISFRLAPDWLPTSFYPVLSAPLFGLFLAAAVVVFRRPGAALPPIFAVGLLIRLLTTFDPPSLSSDCYRYAWDGRVQREGTSPYAWAPDAAALAPLRDAAVYPNINRKSDRTVYPPGAQVLFRALPFDVDWLRYTMIAFDLATMVLLARLLAVCGLDPARVVVYAWCPLVVFEVGNNGHVEAAMLPFVVGAVLAIRAGKSGLVGFLVGASASIKLYPILALVAVERSSRLRTTLASLAVVGVLYGAYGVGAGDKVLGFLPKYFTSAEDHNIGLRRLIEWGLPSVVPHPREVAFAACVALMGAGLAAVRAKGGSPEQMLLRVGGVYLLTLPSAFHPWYALWLVPWLCFTPSVAGLWLLATLPLSYLKYGAPGEVMPSWVVPVELIPTVVLLALEARWKSFESQRS